MTTNSNDQRIEALAAGASANFRTNGLAYREDMTNAYQKLKEMIQEECPQMDVSLLDIGAGSAEQQQLMALQLQDTGVVQNEKMIDQAQAVLKNITKENLESLWAAEPAEPPPQHK